MYSTRRRTDIQIPAQLPLFFWHIRQGVNWCRPVIRRRWLGKVGGPGKSGLLNFMSLPNKLHLFPYLSFNSSCRWERLNAIWNLKTTWEFPNLFRELHRFFSHLWRFPLWDYPWMTPFVTRLLWVFHFSLSSVTLSLFFFIYIHLRPRLLVKIKYILRKGYNNWS